MHALIIVAQMDPAKKAEQRVALHERIMPAVEQAPGFRAGTWSHDTAASTSYSHLLFADLETAQALADTLRNDAQRQRGSGVEIVSVSVAEVLGEARGRG